jgi:hypothetical protein
MKIVDLFLAAAIAAMILGLTMFGFAAERQEVVEKVGGHGCINWSLGTIYAKGIGSAHEKAHEKTRGQSTEQMAKADTYSNLFETVKGVRIDSSSHVKDLVAKSNMVLVQLKSMVREAQIVKREYLSNGTEEVTLAFKMVGGFAQLALPEGIKQVPEIKTITGRPVKEESDKEPEPYSPSSEPIVYTGLVLDARGLKAMPAMSPRIISESGEEVYGSAYVSREFGVQQGMTAYDRDLNSAQNNARVSGNPLTVKGLRTHGPGRCDFVISNADALEILSASENLLFLKKCRVVVVLD